MFSIADSSIKNDHKLSGLKQHYFILSQFLSSRVQVYVTWVLCSGSRRLKPRCQLGLQSHLRPGFSSKFIACWQSSISCSKMPKSCLLAIRWQLLSAPCPQILAIWLSLMICLISSMAVGKYLWNFTFFLIRHTWLGQAHTGLSLFD